MTQFHKDQEHRGFKLQPGDEALMEKLSPNHRSILMMTGSVTEIAEAYTMNIGTVKSRQHRARAALVNLRPKKQGIPGGDV